MSVTPQQIMDALRAAYSSCATYRDYGSVHTDFFQPSGELIMSEDRPFVTAFRRPDWFRYEFRGRSGGGGPAHRYIVWRAGAVVRTRWDLTGQDEQLESLALALAGPTGVSGGSAHTVPSLLMPNEFEQDALRRLVDFELVGEAALDGVACHHLTATTLRMSAEARAQMNESVHKVTGLDRSSVPSAEHGATHLWIEIDSCLIRRIERRVEFGSFATASVTTYAGATGISLEDEDLRFDGRGPADVN